MRSAEHLQPINPNRLTPPTFILAVDLRVGAVLADQRVSPLVFGFSSEFMRGGGLLRKEVPPLLTTRADGERPLRFCHGSGDTPTPSPQPNLLRLFSRNFPNQDSASRWDGLGAGRGAVRNRAILAARGCRHGPRHAARAAPSTACSSNAPLRLGERESGTAHLEGRRSRPIRRRSRARVPLDFRHARNASDGSWPNLTKPARSPV